jgi:phosphoribosylglycinamide formyltransferase-1
MTVGHGLKTVVLISGNGTNLQAIIDAIQAGRLSVGLAGVLSDCPEAYGLERAHAAGIPTTVVDYRNCADRSEFDRKLHDELGTVEPELIVLAGFMRIISDGLTEHYRGRMLNIHPSLLPKYPGLHTYQRVLATDDPHHGSTVHFVTPQLDAGPPIIQYRVRIRDAETEESLAARVQAGEYIIYPRTIEWIAERRLDLRDGTVWLDGQTLQQPVVVDEEYAQPL